MLHYKRLLHEKMRIRQLLIATLYLVCCFNVAILNAAPNAFDSFWSGYNNARDDHARDEQINYQRRQLQLEQERLDLEKARYQNELAREKREREEREQQNKKNETENAEIWQHFIAIHPLFSDTDSKHRKYGDYLFISKYVKLIESGSLTYAAALNLIAEETYETLGRKRITEIVAPQPAPLVEAPPNSTRRR